MSGGKFDYIQYRIFQVADELDQYIRNCISCVPDENDYSPGYSPEVIDRFKQCERTLRVAATMLHRVDWLASGDDSEESFHERWYEELNKLTQET